MINITAILSFAVLSLVFAGAQCNEENDINKNRGFNFGPGPAALPVKVLERAAKSLLNFRGTGIGIMEYTNLDSSSGTHPGTPATPLQEMMMEAENKLRSTLSIPSNYDVLFMHGGAVGHFSAVPMNFLGGEDGACADYLEQGFWSHKAFTEAKKYGDVSMIGPFVGQEAFQWKDWAKRTRSCSKYLAVVLSETVQGVELLSDPPREWSGPPIVLDATSTLLSRPIDVAAYGMIYASGGKNIPHGVSVIIIRREFLESTEKMSITPALFDYRSHAGTLRPVASQFESRPNTPPVWGVYLLGEVLDHLAAEGGLEAQVTAQANKAGLLYRIIDASNGFYINNIHLVVRSRMNVVFNLKSKELEKLFIDEAEALSQPLPFLWGHPSQGGVRVTTYNWVTEEGVKAVATFMQEFLRKHGGESSLAAEL